jgi:sodium transport system permease protein
MYGFSLHLTWRMARKELREILRDRRTIFTLVLMPVLLYPLMSIAFNQYAVTLEKPEKANEYHIAIQTQEEQDRLTELLHLTEQDPKLARLETDNLEESIRKGHAHLAIRLKSLTGPFRPKNPWQACECELIYRDDSIDGLKALEFVKGRLEAANLRLLIERLELRGEHTRVLPVETKVSLLRVSGKEILPISTVVPLILVLMTITGAVYPAIDLTAGERERGTLEILMAAPIPRFGLLMAKFVAVLAVALLTALVNMTMMTVTVLAFGLGDKVFGAAGLSFGTVAAVLGLLVLFAGFFSGLLLAVTSFARSFKEAQAYLIPLMLLALAPGVLSLLDIRLSGMLSVVPLLNVVLLAREIFAGSASLADTLIVVVSTLFYATAAIGVAARIFGAEAVLYSEQGQWSDMFRRPPQPRPVVALSTSLFCLAIMFPVHFLLNSFLAVQFNLLGVPIAIRLLASIAESVLLFGGFPFASAYLSRAQFPTAFQLRGASLWTFVGALLLGVSLWPLAGELSVLLLRLGLSSMSSQATEAIKAMIDQWRERPVLTILAIACVAPMVEELFFRGYLFNALSAASRPRTAILTSALLFGVFHLLVGGTLAVERLVTTTLLGLALAWVRWSSGSVFPGMLLHGLNNGLLVVAALFPGAFGSLSDVIVGASHIPPLWLVAGAVGAAIGICLTWFGRSSDGFLPDLR